MSNTESDSVFDKKYFYNLLFYKYLKNITFKKQKY